MKQKKEFLIFFIIIVFAFSLVAQNIPQKQGDEKFFQYRGSRMSSKPSVFFVLEIEAEHEDDAVELEIKFNTHINPASMDTKFILINEKPLPQKTRVKFNKAGTKIELTIPQNIFYKMYSNPFSIRLTEAKSFNSIPLQKNYFENIYLDCEYRFPPPFPKDKMLPNRTPQKKNDASEQTEFEFPPAMKFNQPDGVIGE